jgi:maleate isomerase
VEDIPRAGQTHRPDARLRAAFCPLHGGPEMSGVRRVGMLTPSSNTVLEPYTSAMFAALGGAASAHFGRFRVVEISMSEASQSQFRLDPILDAARLLADARVDLIAWNGTSASWLGLDKDRALCAQIEAATGIAATSTMLAYEDYYQRRNIRRLGLVTPYLSEIQDRIIANCHARGIEVVADRRLEDPGNFSFATHDTDLIRSMIRDVGRARPDAIAVVCTNFRGAPVAAEMEAELGMPVIDSVSVTAAQALRAVGLDPARVTGWGRVFGEF